MAMPQHFYLVALCSTVASGLTSLPRSPLYTTYPTALRYQDNAFIDVEVLSHQKFDILRATPATSSESQGSYTASKTTMSPYREIRIPLDWYPEKQTEDTEGPTMTSCSAYRRKEIEASESTVIVKVMKWKKQIGDIVKKGDIMMILQKSQMDFYGRTVSKQRFEIASKEDGILKSIVVPQDAELNLSTHSSRSFLALFHPTAFHCIDIDEVTRMDTTLSHPAGSQQESKQVEMESPKVINELLPRSANTTLDLEEDVIGSYQSLQYQNRTNTTSMIDDRKYNSILATDATLKETSQGESEGCDSRKITSTMEKQVNTTTATDTTKEILNQSTNTANGIIPSNEIQAEDKISKPERIINTAPAKVANQSSSHLSTTKLKTTKAKYTDCGGAYSATDTLELLCNNANESGLPSNQNQVEVEASDYERIIDLAAEEVSYQLFSGISSTISKATETDPTTAFLEPSSNINGSGLPSNPNQVEIAASDYERIVDMAAAEVTNQLFSDLSLTISKTTKAQATGSPSNLKLNKNATTPEPPALPNNKAMELEQTFEKEALDETEDDQQNHDEPWGSQKSEIFTVIVDFFTDTFQKTD
ncbi:MAG: hypothetical protein SGBAC_012493 [Bacillariaceae sp.]